MPALFTALMCQVLMNLDRELPPVCPQPPKLSLEINKTVVEQFEPRIKICSQIETNIPSATRAALCWLTLFF